MNEVFLGQMGQWQHAGAVTIWTRTFRRRLSSWRWGDAAEALWQGQSMGQAEPKSQGAYTSLVGITQRYTLKWWVLPNHVTGDFPGQRVGKEARRISLSKYCLNWNLKDKQDLRSMCTGPGWSANVLRVLRWDHGSERTAGLGCRNKERTTRDPGGHASRQQIMWR